MHLLILSRQFRYIYTVRNVAWGDHLDIQAISNEFSIAINVLSSEHCNVTRVVPRNGNITHEIYIGLILQVGVDKVTLSDNISSNSETTTNSTSNANDLLKLMMMQ